MIIITRAVFIDPREAVTIMLTDNASVPEASALSQITIKMCQKTPINRYIIY